MNQKKDFLHSIDKGLSSIKDEHHSLSKNYPELINKIKESSDLTQDERNHYDKFLEDSRVAVIRYQLSSNEIIEASKKAWELLKTEPQSGIDIFNYLDDDKILSQLISNGFIENCEVLFTDDDDNETWLSIAGKHYEDQGYIELIAKDISDWKYTAIKLQEANFQLDNFIYHASHDLRAPLLSILGLTDLISKEKEADTIHHYNNLIVSSISKLDNFITDMMTVSRNEREEKQKNHIDINKLLKECLGNLEHHHGFEDIDFKIKMKKSCEFYSDTNMIMIILKNVIANAIQYQRPLDTDKTISISLNILPDVLKIRIEDNGEGISDSSINKIFDMFYRGSEQSKGSGLGLYIVNNILTKLSGSIKVKSKLGKGSTFKIKIPNQG